MYTLQLISTLNKTHNIRKVILSKQTVAWTLSVCPEWCLREPAEFEQLRLESIKCTVKLSKSWSQNFSMTVDSLIFSNPCPIFNHHALPYFPFQLSFS